MDLQSIKKNNEYVWAEVFIDFINKKHSADYTIEPELGESSPVDMYAISKSGKFPQLNLQLTHAVEVPFVAVQKHEDVDFSNHPTIEAIEHKTQKLTNQGADLSQIVLVVQGYMNQELADNVFDQEVFTKFKNYPFAGIYYVAPPMISAETNELMQDGVVVAIKDYFNA